jgi:uncharacterized lipoprotein YmbA
MMISRLALCIVPIACALSSCRTATVHLYTLSTPLPVPASSATVNRARDAFIVDNIRIPGAVDRKELVVRKSANELALLENENWAAPLREEVWRALVADLQHAMRDRTAIDSEGAASRSAIRIDIRVWEASTRMVYLNAEWRIRSLDAATPVELRCESDLREITSGSAGDIVRADQALLEELAKSIALAAGRRMPPHRRHDARAEDPIVEVTERLRLGIPGLLPVGSTATASRIRSPDDLYRWIVLSHP